MPVQKFEKKDEATAKIYKGMRACYDHVKHRLDALNPGQRKYFDDVRDFLGLYEAKLVKVWTDFFMTTDELKEHYDKEVDQKEPQQKKSFERKPYKD